MAYIIFGLLACAIVAWIWAEYNIKTPITRVTLGAVVVLAFCVTLYTAELRNFYHNAQNSAAFRMLGEALEDGDVESARNALDEYNAQDPKQTGHIIVNYLADRKRENSE